MPTTIQITESTRDDIRKYKAEHGLTYDEALQKLLRDTGWFDE